MEGHAIGSGYDFSQEVYDTTPAASITGNLDLSQDAANVILGSTWRIPTKDDLIELINNCSHIWTNLHGVNGVLLTSRLNGNRIFFPVTGRYDGTTLDLSETSGYYWTSSLHTDTNAYAFNFNSSDLFGSGSIHRRFGLNIRPVM